MLRFYLIATAIVLVAGVAIAALYRGGSGRDLRVASVQTTASPSPPRRQDTTSHGPIVPTGDAPWAMSAVPECFRQRREVHGPPAYVRAALPASARPLAAGTVVTAGDCTVTVGAGTVLVRRADETLRVPPQSTLYALAGGGYALFRRDAQGTTLRVYERSGR